MDIHQYVERYKKTAKENSFPEELLPTDEEYTKMFISHMVVIGWQSEENEKQAKDEEKERLRKEYFKQSLWKA